jgi:formylmethanofuran dehydrogenase subunit B
MSVSPASAAHISELTCPFCGLLCDDLGLEPGTTGVAVRTNGCALAEAGFARALGVAAAGPRVAGREATLEAAVGEAARLLRQARQPLFAGLATDVHGARAIGALADRCGGVLDHMNSAATVRNLMVLQDGGWISTTLSEIRNRCDLLVVAGADITGRFPRFFERCVLNRETLFGAERQCEVVFLGCDPPSHPPLPLPFHTIACEVPRLGEAFSALRAIVAKRPLLAGEAAGVPMATWTGLAARMRAARYGVVAWAAPDFDFPHADLTIQVLSELVKDLNRATRFSGLPLGGNDGDVTVDSVHLWQTGFATRTSFGRGVPEHDPYHYSTARLVGRGETDLVVWVSSFNAERTPPATGVPTVVLGQAGMRPPEEPAVFIPVGTPGVDHAGHLFRTDRVVALPLAPVRPSTLPSVADVITAIGTALEGG